jgi:flagellar hook-length control protein FliK
VTTEATLREPVGGQRWKDELGVQLTLMAAQGKQSGSLRLSPEHLGPLEIQITVNDDKTTNVQFGAQHADTRAALQDALPRLREMFTAAGLQLGDAGVSGEAPRQRAEEAGGAAALAEGRGDGEPSHPEGRVRSITHSGLLDTYA